MNYLAIDTSGKTLTVILSVSGIEYKKTDCEGLAKHSSLLMPAIENLLETANASIKDLDFLACVVGAGSFTGIRIGVATVKALCLANDKPCLSVTSFDCIAYNKQVGRVMAVIDAKHDGFYACGYQDGKVILPPVYIMKEQLLEYQNDFEFYSGESIENLQTTVVCCVNGLTKAVNQKVNEISCDLETLIPLYVRKSQAEEGR